MTTEARLMTADDLWRMPDNGKGYELVRGELRKMAPAGGTHGIFAERFSRRLGNHVEVEDLGAVFAAETGFRIERNPDTVRAPDVAFVDWDYVEAYGVPDQYLVRSPNLAVEVISPWDTFSEVEEKAFEWLATGCRAVVLVDPRRKSVTVYRGNDRIFRLGERDELDLSDVVPGFRMPLAPLFAPIKRRKSTQ